MTATVQRVNGIFDYRFMCPIDKKWAYFSDNDSTIYFGACKKFMGGISEVVPATFNKQTMKVSS